MNNFSLFLNERQKQLKKHFLVESRFWKKFRRWTVFNAEVALPILGTFEYTVIGDPIGDPTDYINCHLDEIDCIHFMDAFPICLDSKSFAIHFSMVLTNTFEDCNHQREYKLRVPYELEDTTLSDAEFDLKFDQWIAALKEEENRFARAKELPLLRRLLAKYLGEKTQKFQEVLSELVEAMPKE
ncbi:MAG: hypothetical protein DWQ19_09105 [Crenarchaeota archaeon]|nr:MAG: hypothetical protein DWQ19_09105 [Thermoproteota archaeon]